MQVRIELKDILDVFCVQEDPETGEKKVVIDPDGRDRLLQKCAKWAAWYKVLPYLKQLFWKKGVPWLVCMYSAYAKERKAARQEQPDKIAAK